MQRWEKVIVAVLAIYTAVWWYGVLGTRFGWFERHYARVEVGMPKEQVADILGNPTSRILKGPQSPNMEPHIWNKTREPLTDAAEVWKWQRFVQVIGVVFGDKDRVIYKWVDY